MCWRWSDTSAQLSTLPFRIFSKYFDRSAHLVMKTQSVDRVVQPKHSLTLSQMPRTRMDSRCSSPATRVWRMLEMRSICGLTVTWPGRVLGVETICGGRTGSPSRGAYIHTRVPCVRSLCDPLNVWVHVPAKYRAPWCRCASCGGRNEGTCDISEQGLLRERHINIIGFQVYTASSTSQKT